MAYSPYSPDEESLRIIERYDNKNLANTSVAANMQLELLTAKLPSMDDKDKPRAERTVGWLKRVLEGRDQYGRDQ